MNSDNNTIIKIEHVSKKYRLGTIGGTTLRDEIHRKTAKMLHKEDPTLIIGQKPVEGNEEFYALTDISLEVKQGEAVGIIGRNGAGKSTLLKLLCRVTAPTEGVIGYNGRITSMLEVGTGFHPELTGRENIYLNGAILGMTRKEIDLKMEDIIEFSECRQFIDTPVKRYSSGMKVKLAFSVSAHLDSEIMIMDEVLAVGDMAFQKKCLAKMKEAASKEGRTVLYVSHNMNTIRQLCERCIVLHKGRIVFDGGVEEAIDLYLETETTDDVSIDYTDIPRLGWLTNTKIRTLRASYVDREDIIFDSSEPMDISLEWVNEQDIENLCLRVEILKTDRTPIGTSMLYDFYSGHKGEEGSAIISLDLSMLSAGNYTMNYTFFERNEYGSNRNVDCVHGLYFVTNEKEEIYWDAKSWGNVVLPEIEVKKNNGD